MGFDRRLNCNTIFVIVLGVGFSSCIEPFNPSITAQNLNSLVVEGYINAGPGVTTVTLSKAQLLDQGSEINREKNASVWIENDAGDAFPLFEVENGKYSSQELSLPLDKQYRLYIQLTSGQEFRSQFLQVKVTPPIDSLSWEWKPDKLYLYVNTHNNERASLYYQWSYREDWQIRSQELSQLVYREDTIRQRPSDELLRMLNCWKSAASSALIFSSSKLLQEDVMKFPIRSLTHGAEQNRVKYSIIVNQHTLTKEEYNYLTLIVKNSTQVGSFFDPMPSQVFGNIVNLNNSNEQVIGYVGVYTTQSDTLFIYADDLPSAPAQESCDTIHFQNNPENLEEFLGGSIPPFIPYNTYYKTVDGISIPMVIGMIPYCLDCRLRGTNIKPGYWH